MELKNFSLIVGKNRLINNLNIKFQNGYINHILGDNGVGKSTFAKACLGVFPYEGEIIINGKKTLIGSYTNIPLDLNKVDVMHILYKYYDKQTINRLYDLLRLEDISNKLNIKKMSDGQKQKIKILFFLSLNPDVIILDEFTSSLDRKSSNDLYNFMNEYVKSKDLTVINITHNLADLTNMEGFYYIFKDQKIKKVKSQTELLNMYLGSEVNGVKYGD